ncbi:MAG TPA: DNA primase catalytic subunit PriS [Candidatus Thermoplasmatota archaeon]|jgi:DNA primase small subunit|nr:DNA primase catalytic subunit PriS [Candidatus Thermoplasmatota archaeon]
MAEEAGAQAQGQAKPAGPPPEVQARIDRTVAWASERFSAYYERAELHMPVRLGKREWGFMWLGKHFVVRHTSFRSEPDLRSYLVREGPAHVYYSTAYYENPRADAMKDKGWLGADLIFDLDADHIEAAKDKGFEDMLKLIQREAVKLAHDFLLGDLGFRPDQLRVVFSGGRGYHLHVQAPEVFSLGSAERREIVDYVEGVGLDLERVLGERVVHVSERAGKRKREKRTEASGGSPGWAGRIVRGELELLEELRNLEPKEARARTKAWGLSDDKARELLSFLHSEAVDSEGRTFRERFLATGHLPKGHALDKALRMEALQKMALAAKGGEADEPVTSDIKRLIRLPGSVHGKTALRVVPVPLERLESFDPLREAVAFGDEPVTLDVSKPEKVRLKGKEWDLQPGRQELPEHVALFVALRRKALLV